MNDKTHPAGFEQGLTKEPEPALTTMQITSTTAWCTFVAAWLLKRVRLDEREIPDRKGGELDRVPESHLDSS